MLRTMRQQRKYYYAVVVRNIGEETRAKHLFYLYTKV